MIVRYQDFTETMIEITRSDVLAAQNAWCKYLLQISNDFREFGIEKASQTASQFVDEIYDYKNNSVLFKPTFAKNPHSFRTTKDGAISYFIGHNENYPEDQGFALNNWINIEIENQDIIIIEHTAITMGKAHLTNTENKVYEFDKTLGFRKYEDGSLKLFLHHSSVPPQ